MFYIKLSQLNLRIFINVFNSESVVSIGFFSLFSILKLKLIIYVHTTNLHTM